MFSEFMLLYDSWTHDPVKPSITGIKEGEYIKINNITDHPSFKLFIISFDSDYNDNIIRNCVCK